MKKSPRQLNKSSRWGRASDLTALKVSGPMQGRFILGKFGSNLIATPKETSILVIGPTRSGKTTSLITPNLFEWDGPAVSTSTKAELIELTGARRQRMGPVYVYDPTGEIGNPSGTSEDGYITKTFSPLYPCFEYDRRTGARTASWDNCWKTASWMAAGMNKGGSGGGNDWRHWAESAKSLMGPLFYAAISTDRSIREVCKWIANQDLAEPTELLEHVQLRGGRWAKDAERALDEINSIDQRPEKERGTVFSTTKGMFSIFAESNVMESAMSSGFDPEKMLREKGTLYLVTPSDDPDRVASLFITILMTVITRAFLIAKNNKGGRLDPELGLFLDELANVCPIENLDNYASQGAGRGVIMMTIVQDVSQLIQRYGKEKANTIFNNHRCKIVLPGLSDPDSSEYISKMIGQTEQTDYSYSFNDGKKSKSMSTKQIAMAPADQLRQIPAGNLVMIFDDKPPVILKMLPWYKNERFTEMASWKFMKRIESMKSEEVPVDQGEETSHAA